MPELRSGSKKSRGRGRAAGTPARGARASPSAPGRGRGANTASRGRGAAANARASPAEARQASLDAVAVAEEEQAEPNPATLAAQPPAADMRGKEEGETDKDAPPGEDKAKEEDASTAPLPEKVSRPLDCRAAFAARQTAPLLLCQRADDLALMAARNWSAPSCSVKSGAHPCTSWSGSLARVALDRSMSGGVSRQPMPRMDPTPTMCVQSSMLSPSCTLPPITASFQPSDTDAA